MSSPNAPTPALRYLAAPLLAAGLALTACGGDDDDAARPAASAPADSTSPTPDGTAATADFNDADIEFAQGMIGHHEQAIEMAEIAEDPARQARDEVTNLAGRVKAAQDPEIETMTAWLTAWGQPVEMDTSGGHDMSTMTGMMSAEYMDSLATMTGTAFDDMWLTMMIEHHTGAIEMATQIQADGVNPDVKTLATQIITAQQAEIDEMSTLLDS